MKIVTSEEMRLIESRCEQNGISTDMLMENAGLAVAQSAREFLGDVRGIPILVLVGSGNNGNDGIVAAHHLTNWGSDVTVYFTIARSDDDAKCKFLRNEGILAYGSHDDVDFSLLAGQLSKARLIIDAILGTGMTRPIEGDLKTILSMVSDERSNRPTISLMALDVPSGLNADTGELDPCCLAADVTVTLGYPKVGLFEFPGAGHVGQLSRLDIGIPSSFADDIPQDLITSDWVSGVLPRRYLDSHKGTFGRVLIIAGSTRYIGAAYLACVGAARVGAGTVTLAIPSNLQPILAGKLTETTYLPLPEDKGILSKNASDVILAEAHKYQAILIGCGLGQRSDVANLLRQLMFTCRYPGVPMVLDADALNIMATLPEWWNGLNGQAILTPHPGEMSRLTGIPTNEINAARLSTTRELAIKWNKSVVLKGAYTVISSPEGQVRISPFVNPGLASAGTGDVLAGVTVGLLAQGLSSFDAASCASYIHGAAGEQMRAEIGDTGMIASDLLTQLPLVIKHLKDGTLNLDRVQVDA